MATTANSTKFNDSMLNTQKNNDLVLFEQYKATHDKNIKNKLLQNLSGLINGYINKWVGPVPRDVLYGEALVLAGKAIENYDPSKGVQLSTYITNNLAPISRVVYTYQNSVRIPENMITKFHTLNTATDYLTTVNGRTPTTDELHSYLGWGAKQINKLKNLSGSEFIESAGVNDDLYSNDMIDSSEEDGIYSIYYSLLPEEKQLLEDLSGFNGAKKLTVKEILKKYGWTQSQLSYKKSQLTKKIKTLESGRGRTSKRK